MSVCVTVRTTKELTPDQIIDHLFKQGETIVITSKDFPFVKFGTMNEALRGIEINKVDAGYEVRVCAFANKADHRLFSLAIDAIMQLSKGKAYFENDDDDEVLDPIRSYDERWFYEQQESSANTLGALIRNYGVPVVLNGIFSPFCIGPYTAKEFDWDLIIPEWFVIEDMQAYFTNMQWKTDKIRGTSSRLALQNPNNSDDRMLNISLISAQNGKVEDFDYISYADLVGFMDTNNDEALLIRIEDLRYVLPQDLFYHIDDYQCVKAREVTYEDFKTMVKMARRFQMDDWFYHPTFPGHGYDEKQKTIVLMWNPAISSVSLEDHNHSVSEMLTEYYNWSVYEHDKARKGDRFFLVRCGEGKTGIVMSGVFNSNPYEGDDWSGRGRQVYYMDLKPTFILNPETAPMVTTRKLEEAIPSFKWDGGHSGRQLTDEQAKALESLWAKYLNTIQNKVDGKQINLISQ